MPDELPELGLRSMQRGRAIRRRRMESLALALVIMLLIPGGIYSWLRASETKAPPVDRPTTPTSADALPRSATLDPDNLPLGEAPSLGVVRGRTVQLGNGQTVKLPADQVGSVVQYRFGVAWVAGSGRELRSSLPPLLVPLPMAGEGQWSRTRPRRLGAGANGERAGAGNGRCDCRPADRDPATH